MKIMVIGHLGYVGSSLKDYLSQRFEVVGWERDKNMFSLTTGILKELKVDIVVNCAVARDRETKNYQIDSPADCINVQGTRHLANILNGTGIGWIQMSTKDVYGLVYNMDNVIEEESRYRPKELIDDARPFHPMSIYAKSQLIAEYIAESHPRANVIRLSSCYSDEDHSTGGWVVQMIKTMLRGGPLTITNNGKQFRDLLHVNDIGRLIELMIGTNRFGLKLNAGGGESNLMSLLELVDLVDPTVKREFVPGNDVGFAFNNRGAKEAIGWSPTIDFRKRLPTIIENIRVNLPSPKKS